MSDQYIYKASVKQWIAADVVEVVIDLGFNVHKVQKLKIFDFEPPSLKETKNNSIMQVERAELALNYARKVLKPGSIINFQSVKQKYTSKNKHKYQVTILYKGGDDEVKDFAKVMKSGGHSR